jgi:hypothetical protein
MLDPSAMAWEGTCASAALCSISPRTTFEHDSAFVYVYPVTVP